MLINLSELFPHKGKQEAYTRDIEMTRFQGPNGAYEIVKKEPVTLVITNQGNKKLRIRGRIILTLSIPCDRCLEPVEVPFDLPVDQMADMNQSEGERVEALDEQPYICGYNLDVDQLVGNELRLNLPMKVLCDENCEGICNRCGTNPGHGTGGLEDSLPDPRMSVIQDIFRRSGL